jgi:hypothetical protein
MAATEKPVKVSIGFHGGQVLAARVAPATLERFREVLGQSGGWYELEAEDATVMLDLTRIDYLLVDNEDHRVGF